ncbi:hypothetical protein MPLB_130042 [Mesorhizobium sp. ORS 3324]|nr:hypothetical protein MPLB_130042 [Mesorhizobium sp. ORS 3324]
MCGQGTRECRISDIRSGAGILRCKGRPHIEWTQVSIHAKFALRRSRRRSSIGNGRKGSWAFEGGANRLRGFGAGLPKQRPHMRHVNYAVRRDRAHDKTLFRAFALQGRHRRPDRMGTGLALALSEGAL